MKSQTGTVMRDSVQSGFEAQQFNVTLWRHIYYGAKLKTVTVDFPRGIRGAFVQYNR
jgi:hypothetical protein